MTKNELATLTELLHRLYGQNGFEGDMQEIKKSINHLTAVTVKTSERLCIHDTTLFGKTGDAGLCKMVETNTDRIVKLMIVSAVIGAVIGGGMVGVFQILI